MSRVVNPIVNMLEDVEQVGVYDIDEQLAQEIGNKYGNGKAVTAKFDAGDESAAEELLTEYDAAISCVTYKYNPGLRILMGHSTYNIEDGIHFLMFVLGGFTSVYIGDMQNGLFVGIQHLMDCVKVPALIEMVTNPQRF